MVPPPTPPGYEKRGTVEQITQQQVNKANTIYSSSYGSIILKNFLAGAARSFGTVIIYAIFLGISLYGFSQYVWPKFEPIISSIEKISTMTQSAPSDQDNGVKLDPETVNQILQNVNK